MPVLDQFAAVTAFSLFALGFAATVREYRTDFAERWAARIVGACGVLFLLAFSFRMTLTVDRLQHQIVAQTKAKSVSEQHGAAVYQVTLKSGRVVELGDSNAGSGTVRSMSSMGGCSRSWDSITGTGYRIDRGQHAPIDSMPIGQSWQWAAATTGPTDGSAAATGNAPDF